MNEEKKKILEMIEAGVISSEEGLKLLEALENDKHEITVSNSKGKWLRIKITERDKSKLNIRIPFRLVKLGMKIGGKYSGRVEGMADVDIEQIVKLVESGAVGKIVEIEGENELIEIFVD